MMSADFFRHFFRYLDAHLLSKGLDPLKIEATENGKQPGQGQDKISAQN